MITEVIKRPNIILPKRHIILISHMRANTTLLGHIFGSHDDISGYYEHHIGYYSWKSLLRKKIKFFNENPREPVTSIYFDKVLHNEHYIDDKVLKSNNVSAFFMLRQPEMTVKSIVSLYKKIDPKDELANPGYAAEYYINRLEEILRIASKYSETKEVYYLDSEALVSSSELALSKMSDWFSIKPELKSEYKTFDLSGKKKYGDSSDNIKKGVISTKSSNYDGIEVEKELLKRCVDSYNVTRDSLLSLSKSCVTHNDQIRS